MALGNSATMVVDGYAGAGVAMQAKSFSNIVSFTVDVVNTILTMVDVNGRVIKVAIETAATMVVTIVGGNYTVTIAD